MARRSALRDQLGAHGEPRRADRVDGRRARDADARPSGSSAFDAAGVPVGPVHSDGRSARRIRRRSRAAWSSISSTARRARLKALGCPIHFLGDADARSSPGADARASTRARCCASTAAATTMPMRSPQRVSSRMRAVRCRNNRRITQRKRRPCACNLRSASRRCSSLRPRCPVADLGRRREARTSATHATTRMHSRASIVNLDFWLGEWTVRGDFRQGRGREPNHQQLCTRAASSTRASSARRRGFSRIEPQYARRRSEEGSGTRPGSTSCVTAAAGRRTPRRQDDAHRKVSTGREGNSSRLTTSPGRAALGRARVSQLWESSTDAGATWTTAF